MKQLDRRWKVLLVTAVAVFMAFLDVTIVNVAFPSIRQAFPDTSLAGLSWVLNAYNIVFAALLVPAGRLADLLGRRRLFFIGMSVFLAASAACGLAPSVEVLIGARAVQAVGAALLVPTSLGLLLPEFPPERRATATALWGAIGGVAAATGPSLGGVLIEWTDWRLVFFVNLGDRAPRRSCPRGGCCARRATRIAARCPTRSGIVLLAGGVGALSLAIVEAPDWGWGSARILGAFAAAAVAARRRSCGARPRTRTRCSSCACSACARSRSPARASASSRSASTRCCSSNILFLTGVWHYSILKAGFAVTPGPLMAAASSAVAGRIADRFGQRVVAVPGGLLFARAARCSPPGSARTPAYLTEYLPGDAPHRHRRRRSRSPASARRPSPSCRRRASRPGSAITACFRQLGAVLGIAVLIALLGAVADAGGLPRGLDADGRHRRDRRARRAHPPLRRATVQSWTSKSAPSTTPSPERAPSAARS